MEHIGLDVAAGPGSGRDTWQAMRRGFVGRCPSCGEGHLFRAYLKVRDACESCGEAFHHHRADDAPPYVTLLIVTHIFGFVYVGIMSFYDLPLGVEIVIWPTLVLVLCLALLPRVKGALIGLQWALRMHGFSGEEHAEPAVTRGGREAHRTPSWNGSSPA